VARWSYVAYGPGLATQQARKLEFYWSGSLEAPERATCTRSRNISTLKRRPVPKSGAGSGHGEIGILVVLRVPPNPISIQPGDTFVETSVAKSTKLGESNQSRIEAAPRRAAPCAGMGVRMRYLVVSSLILCSISVVVAAKTVDHYKVSKWKDSTLNLLSIA
jgi:hypothetical protein